MARSHSTPASRRGLTHPLDLRLPGHQIADRVQRVEVFEQDLIYRLGDGHFDVVFRGEVDDGFGGGDAFNNAGDVFEDLVEFSAFAFYFAGWAVAAVGA